MIDPGHGGTDPGTTGAGVKEKDIVLEYSKMLGHFLRELGYTVAYTRDKDITLSQNYRRTVASRGDILISCHINGVGNEKAKGLSTWYRGGSQESKELANTIYNSISELNYFQKYGHGVFSDKERYPIGFYMLRYAIKRGCKACVLLEPGFLTNPEDREVLTNTTKRNKIAKAVAEGIDSYVKANQ